MFEKEYLKLVKQLLNRGKLVDTRNGRTIKTNGTMLKFYSSTFPLLTTRKYPYKSVLGEFAALIHGPRNLKDFEQFGCNYWKIWANPDDTINLDYGNKWIDWRGINQVEEAIKLLKEYPGNRRVIITGWDPSSVKHGPLSLPCCHYTYQFIRDGNTLSLIWIQRSADVMVGLPADAILAWAFLTSMANHCKLLSGEIIMQLGDTHIYEEHINNAKELINRVPYKAIKATNLCSDIFKFIPDNVIVDIDNYNYHPALKFELKE